MKLLKLHVRLLHICIKMKKGVTRTVGWKHLTTNKNSYNGIFTFNGNGAETIGAHVPSVPSAVLSLSAAPPGIYFVWVSRPSVHCQLLQLLPHVIQLLRVHGRFFWLVDLLLRALETARVPRLLWLPFVFSYKNSVWVLIIAEYSSGAIYKKTTRCPSSLFQVI